MSGLTPFQTVGPFLHLGLDAGLAPMTATGLDTAIVIHGRLIHGAGVGIPDGVVEFWAPGFASFGRVWTEADGGYRLETRMPHARAASGRVAAPHFIVRVLGRGILTEYLTRVYFEGETTNDGDAVLREVP